MKEKIAITGLSGVVGKKLLEVLPRDALIMDLYNTKPSIEKRFRNMEHIKVNLGKPAIIEETLEKIKPSVIIHLAAITHIDRCEKEKGRKDGLTWRINVDATERIAKSANHLGSYLMFYSTECVFDGERQNYKENAEPNPKNWYGITKMEAEKKILKYAQNRSIIRSVITYYEDDGGMTQFGFFLDRLKKEEKIFAVTNQLITPTYTPDLVKGSMILLKRKLKGIFHLVPNKKITPFEFANKIASRYGFDKSLIKEKTLTELFGKERAGLRLKNSCLDGEKTEKILNYHPLSVDEVLENLTL